MAKAKKTKAVAKKKPAAKQKVVAAKMLLFRGRYRPCTAKNVCDWINQIAPHDVPPTPWPLPGDNRPWLAQFYDKYCELYEAVRRLELRTYCGDTTQSPFIVTCPGSGGGPDKTGSPPPPQFPPL